MQYVMSWQREDAGDSDDNTDNFSQSFRKTAAILYYGTVETRAVNESSRSVHSAWKSHQPQELLLVESAY